LREVRLIGTPKTPGIPAGAGFGALFGLALAALFFFGQAWIGLPLAPFQGFDWLSRVLPGAVITFGIDTIVKSIRALGIRDISVAAKAAEQAMAVGMFVAYCLAWGALAFAYFRRRPAATAYPWPTGHPSAGAGVGVFAAFPFLWLHHAADRATAGKPVLGAVWILVLFALWGAALGWVYARLRYFSEAAEAAPNPAAMPRAAAEPAGSMALLPASGPKASAVAIDRRTFLVRVGGAAATITVGGAWLSASLSSLRERASGAGTQAWSAAHPLPNAGSKVIPVTGTRPELTPVAMHYRIDINARAPAIQEADWKLKIGGLAEHPMEWALADLRDRYPPFHQFITLACISNPVAGSLIGTQRWSGVPLRRLLQEVKPKPSATHLDIRAADGFNESLPIAEALEDERVMLTYAWDGLPLTANHGFPLRIYRPDHYGMKQPKWIESIELTDRDVPGYWLERGWDHEARMKATSVIDAIGVDMMIVDADKRTRIPIGGIAHAGARGIAKVEVRADDGPWEQAQLREPLSDRTWVLWRYEWPFQAGDHTFTVRCTDGAGNAQIETRAPVRPSGATGLNSKEAML
jgi:DMSO/TMAO reductase YedYZ molybdopterin-dependent catalytic subunit